MQTSGRRSSSNTELGVAAFLLFGVIALLPIGSSLVYAGLYSVGLAGLLRRGLTLEHWAAVLGSHEVGASFSLSLGIASAAVVLTAVLALFLALALREPLRRGPLAAGIYLPLALPGTVAAFLCFQCLSGGGWLARVCLHVGLIADPSQFPDLVQDRWAIGILVTHVGLAVPFFTLLYSRLYDSERLGELETLAGALGASAAQRLRRVTVPLLLRRGSTNLVLLFIAVLGSYEIPLMLGRQSPQMLSVLQMRKFALYDLAQKPEAYCIALLYTLLVGGLLVSAFGRGRALHER